MEEWNVGILEIRVETTCLNCKTLLQTHHYIAPSIHYSKWGQAPNFGIGRD